MNTKKKLNEEWAKPKKATKKNPVARNYETIKTLQKQRKEESVAMENAINAKQEKAYRDDVAKRKTEKPALLAKKKTNAVKAKVRREKRNARKQAK